jgi:hypothetical protein
MASVVTQQDPVDDRDEPPLAGDEATGQVRLFGTITDVVRMRRLTRAITMGIGLLLAAPRADAQRAPTAAAPFACRVDPTIELLSVIAVLAGQQRSGLDFAYRREVLAHFAPFAEHVAVQRARVLGGEGFDDFVAQVGARLGPPPALEQRFELRMVGEGPRGVRADSLRGLVTAARDFARTSDFTAFWRAHAGYYAELCTRVMADGAVARNAPRAAAYFGVGAASYEIVLMPLVPRLGVAGHREQSVERSRLTAFVGPAFVEGDEPRWRTGWALDRIVLHEFAHYYVNMPVIAARAALGRSSSLLEPLRGQLWRADHVATWTSAVVETVVRAAVAEMRREALGDVAERAELREHRSLGFTLVDSVAGVLRAARAGTGSARGWWPVAVRPVIALLDRVAGSPTAVAVNEPSFDGGMALGLLVAAPDSVAFIVPTAERDAALQDTLLENVRRMRDRTAPRATILTDREALARDLRGWTLWAIGTPNGNRWLAAHGAGVPARIDTTAISTENEYRGTGLVFAGAIPSPLDRRRALLLTIGQRVDELARGWWLMTSDYAVMDGERPLERGTLVVDGSHRRFVPDTPLPPAPW